MTRRIRRAALALLVAPLVLAGCTTVPDSSAPQTVQPVNLDHSGATASAPQRNASARTIVSDFLDANADDPVNHSSARAYLTPAARNQWSDQRITIISDRQIKNFDPQNGTLQVTGRIVGTINSAGVYSPSLTGTGNGGSTTVFQFKLAKVDGQYRIDILTNGLLITDSQFQQTYAQHSIYFYDLADRTLVADARWTAIPTTDPAPLATWLVSQLVAGPRPELQDAVSTDTFPTQANADRIIARGNGSALSVEIPGSAQLDPAVRNRLAEQVARTLDEAATGASFTITDGGTAVDIPALGSTSFSLSSFPPQPSSQDQSPELYYLIGGRIVSENGKPLSGAISSYGYYLTSFSLTRRVDGGPFSVAAVEGTGTRNLLQLFLGTQSTQLRSTSVKGELTRPTWAPGRQEVWIGDGSTLHRVVVSGTSYKDTKVQLPPANGGGRIRSVRLSPDGQQISLVFAGSGNSGGTLFVGAVVRDTSGVRVTGLTRISPQNVTVIDADWSTPQRLTAVGSLTSSGSPETFETFADGAFWENDGLNGLPDQPENVTASGGGVWVEVQGTVWEQIARTFQSPSVTGQQSGTVPAYVI